MKKWNTNWKRFLFLTKELRPSAICFSLVSSILDLADPEKKPYKQTMDPMWVIANCRNKKKYDKHRNFIDSCLEEDYITQ